MIVRQRLVVEGTCRAPITAEEITEYLLELSEVTEMVTLVEPVTHSSPLYGWAGWIHWETSGAHFYAWNPDSVVGLLCDQGLATAFFSVDVYTCKAFDPDLVVDFTEAFFDATQIVARAL